MYFTKELFLR